MRFNFHRQAAANDTQAITPKAHPQAYNAPPALRTDSCRSAWSQSWEVQTGYFRHGRYIDGNCHHRRFVFDDRTSVEIQAHVPTADDSRLRQFLALLGFTTLSVCGTIGMTSALTSHAAKMQMLQSLQRLTSSVSQCYAAVYKDAAGQVLYTQYYYGWRDHLKASDVLQQQHTTDPAHLVDFAHAPGAYSWWTWRFGSAEARNNGNDAPATRTAAQMQVQMQVQMQAQRQALIQALASFAPDNCPLPQTAQTTPAADPAYILAYSPQSPNGTVQRPQAA